VLLVEDDAMIGAAIEKGLQGQGYAVDWVRDGVAGDHALSTGVYDLCLLDLGLPRRGGIDVLGAPRRRGSDLPVVILTARDAVADRIAGLDHGADDYLVKPFDLDELAARMRAVLRRRDRRGSPEITYGAITLDPVAHAVTLRGADVSLSAREFALLEALMREPGAVVSRERLEEAVYGWKDEIGSNAIEVHLHHLRRKLGQRAIRNIRGVGYRIEELPAPPAPDE
jgi:two-component system, OmpR family, response regulator QseB